MYAVRRCQAAKTGADYDHVDGLLMSASFIGGHVGDGVDLEEP